MARTFSFFTRFFPTPGPRLRLETQGDEAKQPDSLIIESLTESSPVVVTVERERQNTAMRYNMN